MERRSNVPDIERKADEVLADLREDPGDTGQGFLDAVATMDELEPDHLMALVIQLGRRLVTAESDSPPTQLPVSEHAQPVDTGGLLVRLHRHSRPRPLEDHAPVDELDGVTGTLDTHRAAGTDPAGHRRSEPVTPAIVDREPQPGVLPLARRSLPPVHGTRTRTASATTFQHFPARPSRHTVASHTPAARAILGTDHPAARNRATCRHAGPVSTFHTASRPARTFRAVHRSFM